LNKLPPPTKLLESATVFNWRTHVIFGVPAYLTAALFESERYGGDPLAWFWVASVGLAVTALVIEWLSKFYRKHEKRRWPVALGILAAAGFLRGSTILLLGSSLGLFPLDQTEAIFRLVGGPILVLAAYSTINAVIESYLAFQRDLSILEGDRQQLNQLRSGYQVDIGASIQRQRDRVNQLLAPAMWELQKLFQKAPTKKALQQALIQLESITNDIVRPAAKELSTTDTTNLKIHQSFTQKSRLVFPNSVTPRETFSLWFFFVALFTVATNSQVAAANSPIGLLIVLVTSAPLIIALGLILGPLGNRYFPTVSMAVLLGLVGAATGAVGGLISVALGLATTEALIWQSSSYFFLALQITYAYGLLSVGWRTTLSELEDIINQLELLNSKLRQQVWLRQKSLALELHGSVQSKLTALSKTIENMDPADSDKVNQLIVDIRESLSKVENKDYLDGKSFDELVGELQLLWEGTVDIKIKSSTGAVKLLREDDGLARCVFELFREAVTNSVKHGDSNQVVFTSSDSPEGLAIQIWNDGTRLNPSIKSAGSELFDQLCVSHKLENVADGVLLSAEVAATK
jgi:signal transduction histidine kinase